MKSIQNILTAVIICTILQSCEIVQICPSREHLEQKTFTSTLAPDTKTTLVDGKKVYWTEGDAISIFDNSSWSNRRFVSGNLNANTATFSGYTESGASEYYALYPYRYGASCSDGTITVKLPNSQKAIPGTFDTALNITVAKTADDNLSFRNVCALLKVTVPEEIDDILSLSLASRVPLAGDMNISFDSDGTPSITPVSSNSGKEMAIDNGGEPLTSGDYYFVIAPGEHKFTIGITTTSHTMYAKSSSTQMAIEKNQIVNLGTVTAASESDFVVTNVPSAPISLADEWTLGCTSGKTVSFVSRDANVITSVTDGVIKFGKRPGTALVNVVYNSVNLPVMFDVRPWYKDDASAWTLDTGETPDASVQVETDATGASYHTMKTDANGKVYLVRDSKIWPSPTTDPVLCVRLDDLADDGCQRNIYLNFKDNFNFNGTGFTGAVGNAANSWVRKYRCSDGSSILVYDLSSQSVGGKMLPEDFYADGRIQLKYADVKKNGSLLSGAECRFFGFRSFGDMDLLEEWLAEWSASSGIAFSRVFEEVEEALSSHPCALVNASDIARVRAAVSAADPSDPVYAAYKSFCGNKYAQASYTPSPVETIVRGDVTGTGVESQNFMTIARDAAAAFQLALRWQITGETSYADAAVNILNQWADVCTQITANDNNQYLCAGFQGHALGNAAELLRDYEGWTSADQDDFKTWLRTVWIAKNEWFIDTHGGERNCSLHYWSNWELANLASMLAIGIYLEDMDLIGKVYDNFNEGEGSGCIDNMIPYDPVADPDGYGMIAQSMESGRDQGHATLVVSMCAELCQMAWNIGLDFWGMKDSKVLPMCEYTAKYNVNPDGDFICSTMPFTPYSYCPDGCGCASKGHGAEHTEVSATGRGTIRPCWDLIYSHYHNLMNVSDANVHYVRLFADQLRYTEGTLTGDGGSGDSRYGSNSGAFDQLGWGTMLFYRGE